MTMMTDRRVRVLGSLTADRQRVLGGITDHRQRVLGAVVPLVPPAPPVIVAGVSRWWPKVRQTQTFRAVGVVSLQLGVLAQARLISHRRYRVMSFGEELFSADELLELAAIDAITNDDLLLLADDLAPAVFEEIMLLLHGSR